MKKTLSYVCLLSSLILLPPSCRNKESVVAPHYPEPEEYQGVVENGAVVDLGLSVFWSGYNLGASSPEQSGNYYQWGDIKEIVDTATVSIYKFYSEKDRSYTSDYNTAGKVLDLKDDAAAHSLGGSFRMPTFQETKELLTKCTLKYIKYNGTNGYLFLGPSGKCIFLPCAGYIADKGLVRYNVSGLFWTNTMASQRSSLNASDMVVYAKALLIAPDLTSCGDAHRYLACPIRFVSE